MIDAGGARGKNIIVPTGGPRNGTTQSVAVFGKSYPTYQLTDWMVAYPTACALFSCVLPFLLALLVFTKNSYVDRGTSGFELSNHDTVRKRNSMRDAAETWSDLRSKYLSLTEGASPDAYRVSERYEPEFRLYLVYQVDMSKASYYKNESNLLSSKNLPWLRDFETKVKGLYYYQSLCWLNSMKEGGIGHRNITETCPPFNSALTYYYVGRPDRYGDVYYGNTWYNWEFDGINGPLQKPVDAATKILFSTENYKWFMDSRASPTIPETTLLRTQITIGTPLVDIYGRNLSRAASLDIIDRFVLSFRNLVESSESNHPYIQVYYGGDRIQEMVVMEILKNDSMYPALGTLIIIGAMWIHCHSIVLALATALQLLIINPAGLFLYQSLFQVEEISLLSSIVVFIIFAIGLDSAMIMFSTFNHSGFMATTGRINTLSVEQRMAYTYRKAGVGVFVSNLVAVCCFAMNAISPITAIRRFGGQMVILVVLNCYMFLTFFPSMMLVHHFHFSGRRRNLQRKKDILMSKSQRFRPPEMVEILDTMCAINTVKNIPTFYAIQEYQEDATRKEVKERAEAKGIVDWAIHHLPVHNIRNPFRRNNAVPIDEFNPQPQSQQTDEEAFDMQAFADASEMTKGRSMDVLIMDGSRKPQRNRVMTVPVSEEFWNQVENEVRAVDAHSEVNPLEVEKWRTVGRNIGIQHSREGGYDETGAMLPSLEKQSVFCRCVYDVFRGATFVTGLSYTRHDDEAQQNTNVDNSNNMVNTDTADHPMQQSEQQPAVPRKKPKFWQVHRKVANWWEERGKVEREWCFGRFGRRVGENQEEKERRILSKRVKHEGYSRMEIVFLEFIAMPVYHVRYAILLAWIIIFSTFTAYSSMLVADKTGQNILGSNPSADFDQVVTKFPIQGSCDYCAAYYKPRTLFPTLDMDAVQTCENQVPDYGQQMYASLDRCGVCHGNNACVDCADVVNGQSITDDCNQCVPSKTSDTYNSCLKSCTNPSDLTGACGFCFKSNPALLNWYGPDCSVYCDDTTCPPNRGTCNPYTGECVCYNDYSLGFFDHDSSLIQNVDQKKNVYCSVCMAGFFPAASEGSMYPCTRECNSTYPSSESSRCNCITFTGKCQCPGALIGPYCNIKWRSQCDHGTVSTTSGSCSCDLLWNDQRTCTGNIACNYRGVYHTASEVPAMIAESCQCLGFWKGPACNVCGCRNGGTCLSTGKCNCTGSWMGIDCNICNPTCNRHGSCPAPWGPENYADVEACKGVFCTQTELKTKIPLTTECKKCFRQYVGVCKGLLGPQTNPPTTTAAPTTVSPTSQPNATTDTSNVTSAPSGNTTSSNTTANSTANVTTTSPPTTTTPPTTTKSPTPAPVTLRPTPAPPTPTPSANPNLCTSNKNCQWDAANNACFEKVNFTLATDRNKNCINCKGNFAGTLCDQCPAPRGLSCREPDGVFVGCDGKPANSYGKYKYFDQCGICGGSNSCPGCDGIPGSPKVVDRCGICGGYNECLEGGSGVLVRQTATVYLVFGLAPDQYGSSSPNYGKSTLAAMNLASADVQYHLLWVCQQLNSREDLIQSEKSRCWFNNFVLFLGDSTNLDRYGLTTLGYPLTSELDLHKALFYYMQSSGNFDLIGFNTANPNDPKLRCVWFSFELRSARIYLDDSIPNLRAQYDLWNVILKNVNTPQWYTVNINLTGFLASDVWVQMFTQMYSLSGATYVIAVGGVVTVLIVFVVSCSFTLTVLTLLSMITSVVMCLGIFYVAGWKLGSIEQLAMSLLLGICAEQTTHIAEGYLEYLHSAQSHILARDTTRLQAYRGMLLRTGVPISFSAVSMVAISLLQLGTQLYVFRKVALIIIIIVLVSVFNNLVFFGGFICVVGPTSSYRNATMMFVLTVFLVILCTVILLLLLFAFGLTDVEGNRIAG